MIVQLTNMSYSRLFPTIGLLCALPALSQTCSLTVTPQNVSLSPGGGPSNVSVTASTPGCSWTARGSNSVWIHQTSPTTANTGNGTVAFNVDANTDSHPRTGTVTLVFGTTSVNLQIQILQSGTVTEQLFDDVPVNHPYVNYVNQVKTVGWTTGCSLFPPLYCPERSVSRGQMAVFIVRAVLGFDNFGYSNLPYFDDVGQNHPYFKYIQKLKELGVTGGCSASPALYCPDADVSRWQMAVFMIRGRFGATAANAGLNNSPAPYFTDVAATDQAFNFVQKMKDFGITSGCTATQYCPGAPVSRGQMAVFLTRLFLTQFSVFP
jgi:hypothetical protein